MKNIIRLFYLLVILFAVLSCGQKGALVLPEKKFEMLKKNKVEKNIIKPQENE